MRRNDGSTTTRLLWVVALVAVAVVALTPGGRAFLVRATESLGASAAGSDARYEIAVVLTYDSDGTFEWRGALSRSEYTELDMAPGQIRDKYVGEAKAELAKKLGYFKGLYGEDNTKLTAIHVAKVVVTDLRTSKETALAVQG